MGLVHVFLFFNVKDGSSRIRMASFYIVRLWMKLLVYCVLWSLLSIYMYYFVFHVEHHSFTDLHTEQTHTQISARADSLHCHPHLCVLSLQ